MKARHIILTIAVVVAITTPMVILAQEGPRPGGYGTHSRGQGWQGGDEGGDQLRFLERTLPRMAELLGLSDEQLDQIQAIADEARPEIEGYAEKLQAGREAYHAANDDPTVFDEEAFREHANAQHGIQTELMVAVGYAKAKVYQILTAEQRAQLQEMRSSYGRRSPRRGGGRRSNG